MNRPNRRQVLAGGAAAIAAPMLTAGPAATAQPAAAAQQAAQPPAVADGRGGGRDGLPGADVLAAAGRAPLARRPV